MIIHNVGELVEGRSLYAITSSSNVHELCTRLRTHNVGALAVIDEGELVGIISERDVVMRVVADAKDPGKTTVADVMTPDPVTIDEGGRVPEALQMMLDYHFRHLPVTRGNDVVGMISMRDIPGEYREMYERFQQISKPLAACVESGSAAA